MFKDGVININKPAGFTSHDVVAVIRRRLGIKRVGHTGTLDPMATGVLPVAFGRATRLIEYYDADKKKYRAELRLGIRTDTLDTTGELLEERSFSDIAEQDIIDAFSAFSGVTEQTPPKFSALKVNGRRLYDYARAGEDVEIKRRRIYIYGTEIEDIDLNKGTVKFTVECSKGTYIRTICDDVGSILGTGAAMSSLVRLSTGAFDIDNSVELSAVKEMSDEELLKHVTAPEYTLQSLGIATIKRGSERFYLNGRTIESCYMDIEKQALARNKTEDDNQIIDNLLIPESVENTYAVYDTCGTFLGTAIRQPNGSFLPGKIMCIDWEAL